MNFYELSWGAVCFYYRSVGDHKYCQIMRDKSFLSRLRQTPHEINPKEFEEKVLLGKVDLTGNSLDEIEHLIRRPVFQDIQVQNVDGVA